MIRPKNLQRKSGTESLVLTVSGEDFNNRTPERDATHLQFALMKSVPRLPSVTI